MTQQRSEQGTREQRREALDTYFARAAGRPGNGLVDYVRRLRNDHRAVIDGQGTYRGCACGEVLCSKDLLLAWCDELIASYEAKVAEFAAETLRASALAARAERAEAQIRAVEALQGPLNQLQMTWWSDYPGAEHEKEAARRTLVHQLVKGLSAALAAGLSLQEEQPKHLVGAGGWRACDTAADWAGSDTAGVTCAECLATTTDALLQEEQE